MRSSIESRTGSALILVLWVIGLISMIVVSFAFEAHLEGKIVSYSRRKMQAEANAISGFELAKSYLDHSREINGSETDQEQEEDPRYQISSDLHFGKTVHLSYEFKARDGGDAGSVSVDIEPEDSLRNVNKLTEDDWERLLELIGLPESYWPDIIDSFFDWTDEDDNQRENGAETEDYYKDLEKPYSAANAPLTSVRELLLVRGFTEAILTGGIYDPDGTGKSNVVISNGIQRLLSVYGEGKVNINALPDSPVGYDILMSLPGVEDDLTAMAILEERELGSNLNASDENEHRAFTSAEDAQERLKNIVEDNEFFNNISTSSELFRITSIGTFGRISKRISIIVFATDDVWRVLRWDEEAR